MGVESAGSVNRTETVQFTPPQFFMQSGVQLRVRVHAAVESPPPSSPLSRPLSPLSSGVGGAASNRRASSARSPTAGVSPTTMHADVLRLRRRVATLDRELVAVQTQHELQIESVRRAALEQIEGALEAARRAERRAFEAEERVRAGEYRRGRDDARRV